MDYQYGMQLDIARLISRSDIANKCNVVPALMTYADLQDVSHTLRYSLMGNGCQGSSAVCALRR